MPRLDMAPLGTATDWAGFALLLRRPERLRPSFNFNSDEVVTFLVGKVQHKMTVHPVHITQSSEFFKAALNKEWSEGQTRVVKAAGRNTAALRLLPRLCLLQEDAHKRLRCRSLLW